MLVRMLEDMLVCLSLREARDVSRKKRTRIENERQKVAHLGRPDDVNLHKAARFETRQDRGAPRLPVTATEPDPRIARHEDPMCFLWAPPAPMCSCRFDAVLPDTCNLAETVTPHSFECANLRRSTYGWEGLRLIVARQRVI